MPLPRRTSSTTTHVSDSEPEREAYRRNHAGESSPPDSPRPQRAPQRTPLASVSNTLLGSECTQLHTLETRLSRLEDDVANIHCVLARGLKRSRPSPSPPSTPLPKRRRVLRDGAAIPETPLPTSRMASTPERDEISRLVSNEVERGLRASHRRHMLSRSTPAAPYLSGTRRKLRRRAHEFM
ncbi:hypothetical protein C8R46DRAFT_1119726 [Mycena filopes]|nr:hypothetical protein C8R46DRAFT_1119726 [Mycena filopes]